MAAHDDLLSCTYGSASFQLRDYSYSEEPVISKDLGRTGTKASVTGKGWVEGTDPTDFATKLAAVRNGLRTWAQDFRVTGLGGATEVQILAAYCNDAGPHVSFKMLEQAAGVPLVKEFEFTVFASYGIEYTGGGGGGVGVADGFGVSVEQRTDGMRRVTRKGVISQANALAIYQNTVFPSLLATYPKTDWVWSQRYDVNDTNSSLNYEVSFEQIRQTYIADPQFSVFDGELFYRVERDESHRKTTTISFDFACNGDVQKLLSTLRPQGKTILRERWEDLTYKEQRFRGEIVFLESADMNDLGTWEQTIDYDDDGATLSSIVIAGRDPVLFYGEQPTRRATQSGRAVGIGRFVKAPAPFWPARIAGPGKVAHRKHNDSEWETTWRYEFIFPATVPVNADILGKLHRPVAGEFL